MDMADTADVYLQTTTTTADDIMHQIENPDATTAENSNLDITIPAAAANSDPNTSDTAVNTGASTSDVVIPQIDWHWKRESLRGKKCSVNLYNRYAVLRIIREQLWGADKSRPGEMYEMFRGSCFGSYLEYDPNGNYANSAICSLLVHQVTRPDARPDEAWFRVGDSFARFSKEYTLVTGLRFGTSDFDLSKAYEAPEGGLYKRYIGGPDNTSKYKSILKRFKYSEFQNSPDNQVKFAKLLFVYGFLLGYDHSHQSIESWAWTLIEEDEKWESFPWGSHTFQYLIG